MLGIWQFVAILVAVVGILVTVIIAVLKLGRDTVSKDDLNNSIESLRSEMNSGIESLRSEMIRMFAKMESNFEQLRSDMDRRFAEAAADREQIREEMGQWVRRGSRGS